MRTSTDKYGQSYLSVFVSLQLIENRCIFAMSISEDATTERPTMSDPMSVKG